MKNVIFLLFISFLIVISGLFAIGIITSNTFFDKGMTNKTKIINTFKDNRKIFIKGIRSKDFNAIKRIDGISEVYDSGNYINISFGGYGLAPSSFYFGIFYSYTDDYCNFNLAMGCNEGSLKPSGKGFKYVEVDGDNEYYVEKIEKNFFYYEASF